MTKRVATMLAVGWLAGLLASCANHDAEPASDGGSRSDLGSEDSGALEDASRDDLGTLLDLGAILIDSGPTPIDQGPPGCTVDPDCADTIDCTTDVCDPVTGACRHTATPALCSAGETCDPMTGCEVGRICATDVDCGDTDPCTTAEWCDPVVRVCTYQPLDGDGDGDPPRVCGGGDCDDSRNSVYRGAPELCDARDNDCDGAIDDGATAACSAHAVCSAGRCECDLGTTACGGECVDLTRDPLNCGACGASCGSVACEASTCACPGGLLSCRGADGGSYCADTSTSELDCGSCGNACAGGLTCSAGVCRGMDAGAPVDLGLPRDAAADDGVPGPDGAVDLGSADAGRRCTPSCGTDADCQASCPSNPTPSLPVCCDRGTGTCFNSSVAMCPSSTPTDGGTTMSM